MTSSGAINRSSESDEYPGAFMSCGVRIDGFGLDQAIRKVLSKGSARAVHLCNAYTLSVSARDPDFAMAINRGALNLADGMPVVWIGRRLGFDQFDRRVYGPDLMSGCLDRGRLSGIRHYLYGSSSDTVRQLQQRIKSKWPGAQIVGVESPPFGPIDDQMLAGAIDRFQRANADVIWVGLGTPKQDYVVDRFAALGSGTYVAVGAAFDFIAGTKRQAPAWMRNTGLEWAYRLASEPRRLWKRYLVGNTVFLWHNFRRRPRLMSK